MTCLELVRQKLIRIYTLVCNQNLCQVEKTDSAC